MTKEQKVYDLTEECHDAFSLQEEMGMCPQAKVHLKMHDEAPFFVICDREAKTIIKKEMNHLQILCIIKKGLTGYSSLMLLVKRK